MDQSEARNVRGGTFQASRAPPRAPCLHRVIFDMGNWINRIAQTIQDFKNARYYDGEE